MGKLAELGIHIDKKNSDFFYDPNDSRYLRGRIWDKDLDMFAGEMVYDIKNNKVNFLPKGGTTSPYMKWANNDVFCNALKNFSHKYTEKHPQPIGITGKKESRELNLLINDIRLEFGQEPDQWKNMFVTVHYGKKISNIPVKSMINALTKAAREALKNHNDNPILELDTGKDSFGRVYSDRVNLKDIEAVQTNDHMLYETPEHYTLRKRYEMHYGKDTAIGE